MIYFWAFDFNEIKTVQKFDFYQIFIEAEVPKEYNLKTLQWKDKIC